MKNVSWALGCVAAIVVGCGGAAFSTPDDGGVDGGEADGGGADVSEAGSDASEAGSDASEAGDAPSTCPSGTVQFVLKVASDSATSYCTGAGGGCSAAWLSIRPEGSSTALTLGNSCMTDCNVCTPIACPLLCAAPQRIPAAGEQESWDGTFYDPSTCGSGTSCLSRDCAQAGTYVARMCGNAEKAPEASVGACVGDTTPTCVDVSFTWPPGGGSATVTGVIGG